MIPDPIIYPCKEYEDVAVSLADLLVDGRVDVFSEVTSRGFFDIDFRRGEIVLRSKSFIGLIPINPRVTIHVTPKVPVGNILYLVHRAGESLTFLPDYIRKYQHEPLIVDRAEEIFASALIDCLLGIERSGLLRRYVPQLTERGWRGRILMSPTISRHIARGDRFNQTREVTEFSVDISENQVLKETIGRVLRRLTNLKDVEIREVVMKAMPLSRLFDRVSPSPSLSGNAALIRRLIHRLPASHKHYERSLWLCYFIASRQGLCLESFGPARLESVVINLATVFESYVRTLLQENVGKLVPGCRITDGNRRPVPLFRQGRNYSVAPDIYLSLNGRPFSILDAKYKPDPTRADRYEALAFCEALQVKCIIFVAPLVADEGETSLYGVTPGGIEMYEARFDLNATDVFQEEKRFLSSLSAIVSQHAAKPAVGMSVAS